MELSNSTFAPSATGLSSSATNSAASALSSDFETFIRMLTAQMENQDPLNPIESADFATQLATFSGVEQQVKTNDLLTGLGAQLGTLGVSQLAGWIGMEGRAEAPVEFDGDPVTLTIAGSKNADRNELVVRDRFDNELQRLEVTADRQQIAWQGRDESGNLMPSGTYRISVESFNDKELVSVTPAQVHGRIVEARTDAGRIILVMESGQEVPSSDLMGLRLPE